jgi:STE24 endopeptidase
MIKALALAVLLVLVVLFAATSFTKSEERERTAGRYFTSGEIARGQQYSRGGRLLFWSATALDLLVLAVLAATSFGARLVRGAESLAGGRFVLAVLAVAALGFLLEQLVSFPLSVYAGFVRQKAWGLTDRTFGSWASDYGKAMLLSIVVGAVLTAAFYLLLRHLPRAWWLAAAIGSGFVGVALAWLLPLVIAPLFNTFTPLARTQWAPLESDVRAMLERAHLPVREVLVMDASRQGRNTNAYFSGFGHSRRIVLYDTLLQSHTEPEVLSILAHETGHWTHNHIVKGLVLGTLGALFGFFLLDRILRACVGLAPLNLRALDDPAGLPLVLLLSLLGSLAAMPIANGISRVFEAQADRTALAMGGDPQVFIEAEKRLVRDNIGDPTPSDVRVVFFADHPPALDRIAAAEAWKTR